MNVQPDDVAIDAVNTDSDVNPNTGLTSPLLLLSGDALDAIDIGLILSKPATIGNRVFDDLDGDGVQDRNDLGVLGVRVNSLC